MRIITLLTATLLLAGCASTGLTTEEQLAQKEQLKREILSELQAAGAVSTVSNEQPTGAVSTVSNEQPTGAVEGRVVRGGLPLPNCRVRLIEIDRKRGYVVSEQGPDKTFETTTDEEGLYRFEQVAPGWYKLKWTVPGGKNWVRFLTTEPDLVVEAGETTTFQDIDTARRALGDE